MSNNISRINIADRSWMYQNDHVHYKKQVKSYLNLHPMSIKGYFGYHSTMHCYYHKSSGQILTSPLPWGQTYETNRTDHKQEAVNVSSVFIQQLSIWKLVSGLEDMAGCRQGVVEQEQWTCQPGLAGCQHTACAAGWKPQAAFSAGTVTPGGRTTLKHSLWTQIEALGHSASRFNVTGIDSVKGCHEQRRWGACTLISNASIGVAARPVLDGPLTAGPAPGRNSRHYELTFLHREPVGTVWLPPAA